MSQEDGGSPITGYIVEYRPTSSRASPFEIWFVKRDVLSTTLDDLTPSTEYEVRVRGENAVGRSNPSTSKWAKTKPDSELSKRSEFSCVSVEFLRMFLSLLHVLSEA